MSQVQIHLNDRQQYILRCTVRHYIATAEPVGSKVLAEEYNLNVSPATIRSCLGYLEKAGLLYQPHTSAGRVPSDSGYRIYVDQLITPSETLSRRMENVLRDRLNFEDWSLEALLRDAAQLLATLSGYITLITLPQTNASRLRHLQLITVDYQRVMLIVVTDALETKSTLMELPKTADGEDLDRELLERTLQILSNFLNSKLRDKPLTEFSKLDWGELDREFQIYADWLRAMITDWTRRFKTPSATRLVVSGVSEVLRQPEFSELNQVQTLMQLLEEEQEQLCPLIFENTEPENTGKRVNVRIGSENPIETIRSCTLISSPYRRGGVPVGSVGVLGPTRMQYENAMAMVEAAADYISEALS